MRSYVPHLLFVAGLIQISVLVASALVPLRLDWRSQLAPLPKLIRQLFWVYGGYTVLAILGLAVIVIVNATELAAGSLLARSVCLYLAAFWGIRLALQLVLDARRSDTHPDLRIPDRRVSLGCAGAVAAGAVSAIAPRQHIHSRSDSQPCTHGTELALRRPRGYDQSCLP
jgi:hypothetical protein